MPVPDRRYPGGPAQTNSETGKQTPHQNSFLVDEIHSLWFCRVIPSSSYRAARPVIAMPGTGSSRPAGERTHDPGFSICLEKFGQNTERSGISRNRSGGAIPTAGGWPPIDAKSGVLPRSPFPARLPASTSASPQTGESVSLPGDIQRPPTPVKRDSHCLRAGHKTTWEIAKHSQHIDS